MRVRAHDIVATARCQKLDLWSHDGFTIIRTINDLERIDAGHLRKLSAYPRQKNLALARADFLNRLGEICDRSFGN